MEKDKSITLEQALKAQEYVCKFIELSGGEPTRDLKDGPQPWWTDEVKQAYDISQKFFEETYEKGIIP